MADGATSADPAVQAQLDRLAAKTGGKDILGHERLTTLLARLGDPHRHLPPVFHVAGTNGKGSTCTYLRGAIAAAGMTAHVYTSPHLVRVNERIRIAGRLIDDAELAPLLADVIDAAEGQQTTFFEATTAAALLAFARHPADACIVEVGIGGRLDATTVIPDAVACGIAQLGLDHQAMLGDTIELIAAEKAGIARPGRPLVTQHYRPSARARIADVAAARGATLLAQDEAWRVAADDRGGMIFADAQGDLHLPMPALAGAHQLANAGVALAMLRAQDVLSIGTPALATALRDARWPARLAPLAPGPLRALLPRAASVWLDGAHNVAAMAALVGFMRAQLSPGQRLALVFGLLADKDLPGVLACFDGVPVDVYAVPITTHDSWPVDVIVEHAARRGFGAQAASGVEGALEAIAAGVRDAMPMVVIAGSLYLAGHVLARNDELPT